MCTTNRRLQGRQTFVHRRMGRDRRPWNPWVPCVQCKTIVETNGKHKASHVHSHYKEGLDQNRRHQRRCRILPRCRRRGDAARDGSRSAAPRIRAGASGRPERRHSRRGRAARGSSPTTTPTSQRAPMRPRPPARLRSRRAPRRWASASTARRAAAPQRARTQPRMPSPKQMPRPCFSTGHRRRQRCKGSLALRCSPRCSPCCSIAARGCPVAPRCPPR
mmetsp:Transcript_132276/g.423179  ORF Transcript_132276/g.423179 Transcript_132276/m.423179 type:complete len:219 (+) Transcript_132276:259-915(+)